MQVQQSSCGDAPLLQLHITSGNADGLGQLRSRELYHACSLLGVSRAAPLLLLLLKLTCTCQDTAVLMRKAAAPCFGSAAAPRLQLEGRPLLLPANPRFTARMSRWWTTRGCRTVCSRDGPLMQ